MVAKKTVKHGDVAGRQLEEGDIVASTSGGYAHLKLFKVVGFTAKKIRVITFNNQTYRGMSGYNGTRAGTVTVRDPQQVALVITGDLRPMPDTDPKYHEIIESKSNPF